ncbi:MAG: glycosyltransferase family 39 protein [Anaerolineae bacterium]
MALGLSSIKLRNIVLLVLLLTAFALRLYRLDHQELWGDEAHSAYVSKLPLPSTISPRTETNPPLYHLLLYFWVKLTGSSVFALRFLSLVLGLLTVPLVYRLAWLAFGELVGLLAALLCALSPFQVYYSQEARMYALAAFFTTLSMFLLARIVSSARPRGLWIAYLLATAAAIFTHYYALFVVVAQNAILIALWRRNGRGLRRWLAVQATLVLSYLPWVLAQRSFLTGKASARFDELTLPVLMSIVKRSLVAFSVGITVETPLAYYLTLAGRFASLE